MSLVNVNREDKNQNIHLVDNLNAVHRVMCVKVFKADAYQLQIEMERLNHQAGLLLKKVLEEAERTSILEPMNELKMLWDNLDKKIINRQVRH